MSFVATVPATGLQGWSFLNRTLAAQQKAVAASPAIARETAYFRGRIGSVLSAEALADDRRLLSVALTAFGLEADIGARAFIVKVLKDGTLDPEALSRRLADKRYGELARAFGFGDVAVPNTQRSDFADSICAAYEARTLEAQVGQAAPDLRLALNARRELAALAANPRLSETGKWYAALGTLPLRQVLQTALGLPASFAPGEIDRQVAAFSRRAEALTGSGDLAALADPARLEGLLRRYLVGAQAGGSAGTTPASAALTLLRQAGGGGHLSLYA